MNILEIYSNNTFKLIDSYSLGYEKPINDEKLGGTNDLLQTYFSLDDGNFANVSYYRKYDTDDKYDAVLYPVIKI